MGGFSEVFTNITQRGMVTQGSVGVEQESGWHEWWRLEEIKRVNGNYNWDYFGLSGRKGLSEITLRVRVLLWLVLLLRAFFVWDNICVLVGFLVQIRPDIIPRLRHAVSHNTLSCTNELVNSWSRPRFITPLALGDLLHTLRVLFAVRGGKVPP